MSKTWSSHSEEEKLAAGAKLAAIYKKHGYPKWLKNPDQSQEIVFILNQGATQDEPQVLTITGECGQAEKTLADEISKEIKEALSEVSDLVVKIAVSFGVGGQMPDVVDANLVFEEGRTTVKHEKGQVILYDFWATWCPPCQQPMAHNQHMLETRAADWKDKVRIIGLSIDNDALTVKNHVEAKKWGKVEHYHIRNGACQADKEHKIQGVPHVMLVDTNGEIVFKGHPAQRKLEQDIDALLRGEKIALAPEQQKEENKADNEASTSEAESVAAKSIFRKQAQEFMGANLEPLMKLQRAFLVLVDDSSFDVKQGTFTHKLACHTVLVGPKAHVEQVEDSVSVANQGPWTNKPLQIRKM